MKNNLPEVHHHHSLRLQGYDYSGEGLYFITICTKNRQHSFGKISNGEMILDEIGITAEMMLEEVPKHFGHALVAEQVVMPNHVHLILVLNDIRKFAGDGEMMVDVSPPANLFGKSIVGTVSVIINQYKASVKRWCNKNGQEYIRWRPRF